MFQLLRDALFRRRSGNSGESAEAYAASWLTQYRQFRIVARNWRSPHDRRDELDLICRDRDVLVFVEVKARVATARVPGYFTVNARKKRVVRRAAVAYLAQLRPRPMTFRFDIVEVVLPVPAARSAMTVLHFENIPLFGEHFR